MGLYSKIGQGKMQEIRLCIRTLLAQECVRLTPLQLSQQIRSRLSNTSPAEIRFAIRQMVLDGELIYSQHCGASHIQMGGVGLVQLPLHNTPNRNDRCADVSGSATAVYIDPGLSFGAGDHPTTRLSLEGLVSVARLISEEGVIKTASALDIGTGSGVLAIAAAVLGFEKSIGIDIDPAACFEAKRNALRNGVSERVGWLAGTLDALGECLWEVVMANLRPPTLVSLMPRLTSLLKKDGYFIISGFRPEEADAVVRIIPKRMAVNRLLQNRGWAAMVGQRV